MGRAILMAKNKKTKTSFIFSYDTDVSWSTSMATSNQYTNLILCKATMRI